MDFDYSPKTKELQKRLIAFMDEHIYPAEADYAKELAANTAAGKRWTPLPVIERLKDKAKAAGLWNLFLPQDTAETLAARVLTLEHRLYPAVLRRFAAGDRTRLDL